MSAATDLMRASSRGGGGAKSPDTSTAAGLPIGTTLSTRGVHRRHQRQHNNNAAAAAAAAAGGDGGSVNASLTASPATAAAATAAAAATPQPPDAADAKYGYEPRPGSPPPCRDALRFVQSLGLSSGGIAAPRRDFQNGLLAAELLAKLKPELNIRLASFAAGCGEPAKADNWRRVGALARSAGLAALGDAALAARVSAGESGAATELVERVYEEATGRRIQRPPPAAAGRAIGEGSMAAAGKAPAVLAPVAGGEDTDAGASSAGQANTTSGPRPIRAAGAASTAGWPTFEAPRVAPAGDAAAVWRRFRGS